MKELKVKHLNKKCEEFFKDYPYNDTVEGQIAWLRSVVPDDIDPSIYECIVHLHKIENVSTYSEILNNYWQGKEPVYTKIKLQSIRNVYFNKVKNYDFYIAFPLINEVFSPELVSKFTFSPPCYSIPFFEGLTEKYSKDDMLNITHGMVNGKVTAVFSIEGSADSFYDYSQIPPYGITNNPNHVPF